MDAIQFNKMIDSQITNGEVTSDVLRQFFGAYNYDASTSVSWLINKLRLVRTTLSEKSVEIGSSIPVILQNEEDLKEWVNKHFPEILNDILH